MKENDRSTEDTEYGSIAVLRGLHPIKRLRQRKMRRLMREGCPEGELTRASARLSTAGVIFAALACILLALALIFGGNAFSVNDLYYLYMDVASMNRVGETIASTLSYTAPESNQDMTLYKKGLAVAGDREIKLFNATGRVTLTAGSEFGNPKILACDKYVLVYDGGIGGFSVYNSFDRLYTENTEFPVSTAAVADGGDLAIVTRSQEYRSKIVVYDEELSPICSYGKNDYVISVAFDGSGRYLAIASLDSAEGDFRTTFTVFDCEHAEVRRQVTLDGVLAYRCDFLAGDNFALFCSDRFVIIDVNGNEENEYTYGEGELDRIACGDGSFAMLFGRDGIGEERELLVFDRYGNQSFSCILTEECTDLALFDRFAYVAQDGGVMRIDTRTGKTRFVETVTEGARILVADQEKIMVCDRKGANIIDTWE